MQNSVTVWANVIFHQKWIEFFSECSTIRQKLDSTLLHFTIEHGGFREGKIWKITAKGQARASQGESRPAEVSTAPSEQRIEGKR